MVHPPNPPWRALGEPPRREPDAVIAGLACPLVFSVTGLLLDGFASVASDDPHLVLLRFALVAGASAIAALAAMAIDGDATLS